VTRSSSKVSTDGTVYEGNGAVGITDMQDFQAWAFEAKKNGLSLDDVKCQMVVIDGGRTIYFWNFGREVQSK